MNLEIMSLMAASAAVSDDRAQLKSEAQLPLTAVDGADEEATFSSILLGLSSSLENLGDSIATTLNPSATPATEPAIEPVIAASLEPASEGLTLTSDDLSGTLLPETGNGLPPAQLPVLPVASTSAPPTAVSSAKPNSGLPATTQLAAVYNSTAAAADARSAPPADTPSFTQTAGWFSQRAAGDTGGAAIVSSNTTLKPDLKLPPATGPRPQPSVAASADKAATIIPTPVIESATTVLAERLNLLATQTAAQNPAVTLVEAAGPEPARLLVSSPAAALPTTAATTTSALPEPLSAALNINQTGWDKALGQRLVFMAANGIDSAELRLDPPQLGTVHVKLTMQGDQAQVLLQAANPLARDAMETALPRLRDMLGSEGVALDSAQVSEREQGERQRQAGHQSRSSSGMMEDETVGAPDAEVRQTTVETLTAGVGAISERV
ncbi:MAG: flagellar hook-length control protein FliK [Gammaproteobacteria bacterium]